MVYAAKATDATTISWSLANSGDAADFTINRTTGAVTLTGNPNFEAQSSYSFTVVATDLSGNSSQQAVSLAVNNLDEVAPTITSGATAAAIDENTGAGQTVYTAASTDDGDIHTGSTSYSLKPVNDASSFMIDANTGAVILIDQPDYELKPSYASRSSPRMPPATAASRRFRSPSTTRTIPHRRSPPDSWPRRSTKTAGRPSRLHRYRHRRRNVHLEP